MSNDLRIYDSVPVGGLVKTIWHDMQNQNFLHQKLIPNNPGLDPGKGKIFRLDAKMDQKYDQPTGARDQAQEVYINKDFVEYETKSFRRKYFIDPLKISKMAKPEEARLAERQLGVQLVTRANRVKMEADCAAVFNSTANFTQTITAVSWSNLATSDPIADLNSLAYLIGLDRNVYITDIVFGPRAWQRFCSNANVRKNISIAMNNKINPEIALDLARTSEMTELQRIAVGRAGINGANPGQTEARQFLWNQDLVWIGVLEANPSGSALQSAVAGKYKTYGSEDTYVEIDEYNQPGTHKDSLFVEGESEFDYVVLDGKLGRILST